MRHPRRRPKYLFDDQNLRSSRIIRRCTTARPRTDAGKAIYALALKLTTITTLDQEREWTLHLHDVGQVYKTLLNEKTPVPNKRRMLNHQWGIRPYSSA